MALHDGARESIVATTVVDESMDESATETARDDERFMARALALAANGVNTTHPNPRVGCVLVADGEVIGEGWHRFAGESHAEILALQAAGKCARGATVYLTLEPCSHHGRTPPCVDALIKAGVARAVIAMVDPNPVVNRAGIAALQSAGIEVALGVGEQAAREMNRGFITRMRDRRPWVRLKIAASIDGKTAMASGESQWITSAPARRDAHRLRAASSAILTGIGTVLRDDPRMTARLDGDEDEAIERQPLRVILDSHLSTPPRARILQPPGRALIITAADNESDADALRSDSVEVIAGVERDGEIDLRAVLTELATREVNELLLEAGPRLSGAMLQQQLVDEIVLYLAPDLLGSDASGLFHLPGLAHIDERHRFAFTDVRRIGRDLRLTLRRADDSDDTHEAQ